MFITPGVVAAIPGLFQLFLFIIYFTHRHHPTVHAKVNLRGLLDDREYFVCRILLVNYPGKGKMFHVIGSKESMSYQRSNCAVISSNVAPSK